MTNTAISGLLAGSTAIVLASIAQAQDTHQCARQAELTVKRLEAEVVGTLDTAQRAAATTIVLDICEQREDAYQVQTEEAIEAARSEERESSFSIFGESTDKAGNKRLKRKSH